MKSIILESNKKGHYVPAMVSNGMVYISGQLPFDYSVGKMVEGNMNVQMKQVLNNIKLILNKVDLTLDNIVQCRIYISDIEYWDEVNEIFASEFKLHKPSRVIVPSGKLHNNALIEIEAIAEMESN